jgi:hypothetical protein
MEMGLSYQVSPHMTHFSARHRIDWSSIPIAAPALVVLIFAIPPNFPHQGNRDIPRRRFADVLKARVLKRVDFVEATLLFLATLALTAGFEEAGSLAPWKSAYVITLMTVSGGLWICLVIWSDILHSSEASRSLSFLGGSSKVLP